MHNTSRFTLALAVLAAACGAPNTAQTSATTYKGAELASEAHVSIAEARALAQAARPGEIIDQELERESGGSGLRYTFDIKSADITYEVGIDAQGGAVLENAPEGPNPD